MNGHKSYGCGNELLTPLFLTAGAVIHALDNEQDVRKFGGLQQILLFSYTCLLIGNLALVGTPFLTGFYSKDVILELASAYYSLSANFGLLLTTFSVLTTSYYSFRLLFMVFHSADGQSLKTTNLSKQSAKASHDAPWVMMSVLIFLSLGSIYAGWFFKPMFIGLGTDFWNNSLHIHPQNCVAVESEFLPQSVKLLPLGASVFGGLLAYGFVNFNVQKSYALASGNLKHVYAFLNQRWLYDKLLNETIAYPCFKLGFSFVKVFDKGLLELLPVFGLALPRGLTSLSSKLALTQSGLIPHYATLMIFTALVALTLLSFENAVLFLDTRIALLLASSLIFI